MKLNKTSTKKDTDTLKSLIEQAGFTQKSFANSVKISLSTITYYISGEKLPRVDRFFDMASKLNVSPKTLGKAMGIDVSDVPNDIPDNRSNK